MRQETNLTVEDVDTARLRPALRNRTRRGISAEHVSRGGGGVGTDARSRDATTPAETCFNRQAINARVPSAHTNAGVWPADEQPSRHPDGTRDYPKEDAMTPYRERREKGYYETKPTTKTASTSTTSSTTTTKRSSKRTTKTKS